MRDSRRGACQGRTTRIVQALSALAPNLALGDEPEPQNELFLQIVREGTGISFEHEHNHRWSKVTRSIVEESAAISNDMRC